jgi:medium-chain acyl-[acyl-carrier-protein] hydrolase
MVDSPPERWSETFTLRAYEVDRHGRASLPTICNWLQETAGIHAARLGWSVHELTEQGMTWVLARLRLVLERPVAWGESVRVATWPAGTHRVFALRDFRITTANGDPVGVATTSWLLMSLASRRPVRPSRELEELAVPSAGRALVDGMEKLSDVGDAEIERRLEVRHADLDVNGHANNVSVISWALEALDAGTLERTPRELAVEFRAEATRGDEVTSRARCESSAPLVVAHGLLRRRDSREIARARTTWL